MAATTLQLLDTAYSEYWSLDETIWLQRYEAELENVRAAIDWAATNDRELGVALVWLGLAPVHRNRVLAEGTKAIRAGRDAALRHAAARPCSEDSGKQSRPMTRRGSAIAPDTRRNSQPACTRPWAMCGPTTMR